MSNPTLDAIDNAKCDSEREIRLALFEASKRQARTEARLSDAIGSIGRLEDKVDLSKALIDAHHDNAESIAGTIKGHGDRIERWIEHSESDHGVLFRQMNELRRMLANANDRIDSVSNQLAMTTKRIEHLNGIVACVAPQQATADAPTLKVSPDVRYVWMEELGENPVETKPFFTDAMKHSLRVITEMSTEQLCEAIGYAAPTAQAWSAATLDREKVRSLLVTMSGLIHEVMRARNTHHGFFMAMSAAMGIPYARQWYDSACKALADASARVAEMSPERDE